MSEIFDDEILEGGSVKLENMSENGSYFKSNLLPEEIIPERSDNPDTDIKSNRSYNTGVKNKKILSDQELVLPDTRYKDDPKSKVDKWVVHNEFEMSLQREESETARMRREIEELKAQVEGSRSPRSDRSFDRRVEERGVRDRFQGNRRPEDVRYSNLPYRDEGPSNNYVSRRPSYGGYEKGLTNYNDADALDRMKYLEQDRAELLRKLNEMNQHLHRSSTTVDKHRPMGYYQEPNAEPGPFSHHRSSSSNRSSIPYLQPDRYGYNSNYPEDMREMGRDNFYPTRNTSHHGHSYSDPFQAHVRARNPNEAKSEYRQNPSLPFIAEQYTDSLFDQFESKLSNQTMHHPSCSCYTCYKKQQVASLVSPYSSKKPDPYAPPPLQEQQQGYNSRISNPSQSSFGGPRAPTRWRSDVKSETGDVNRRRPRKVVLAKNVRKFHPVSNGAPIISCCKCFELLKVPKKAFLIEKMQCGACSTVLCFEILDKKLVSIKEQIKETSSPVKVIKNAHGHMNQPNSNFQSGDVDNSNLDTMDTESVSSDTHDLKFKKHQEARRRHHSFGIVPKKDDLPKKDLVSPLPRPPPGSSLQEHLDYSTYNRDILSQFTNIDDQNIPSYQDDEVLPKKVTLLPQPIKDKPVVTENQEPDKLANNLSNKLVFDNQVNLSRARVLARLKINNEPDNGVSAENSENTIRKRVLDKIKNGDEFDSPVGKIPPSFPIVENIPPSFPVVEKIPQSIPVVENIPQSIPIEEKIPQSISIEENIPQSIPIVKKIPQSIPIVEDVKRNVMVNGHAIPEHLIKKAEKFAGPIHPGQFWYDFHAGFWGVMGRSCLGIIPPNIEEFNYPMPENCAGGNTGVVVNGRELHQRDLDLLASRGLPPTRDRIYVIEISGKVFDEETGEELYNLGELAPTVEKSRHGFGMKDPRAAPAPTPR